MCVWTASLQYITCILVSAYLYTYFPGLNKFGPQVGVSRPRPHWLGPWECQLLIHWFKYCIRPLQITSGECAVPRLPNCICESAVFQESSTNKPLLKQGPMHQESSTVAGTYAPGKSTMEGTPCTRKPLLWQGPVYQETSTVAGTSYTRKPLL